MGGVDMDEDDDSDEMKTDRSTGSMKVRVVVVDDHYSLRRRKL
jgi:hypothetical protein